MAQSSEEEKMRAYRDPEHLIEILNRGTGRPVCLCDQYCGNKDKEGCQLRDGGGKPQTYCRSFRLSDATAASVEQKILAHLRATKRT